MLSALFVVRQRAIAFCARVARAGHRAVRHVWQERGTALRHILRYVSTLVQFASLHRPVARRRGKSCQSARRRGCVTDAQRGRWCRSRSDRWDSSDRWDLTKRVLRGIESPAALRSPRITFRGMTRRHRREGGIDMSEQVAQTTLGLADGFKGELIRPGDSNFDVARSVYNGSIRPASGAHRAAAGCSGRHRRRQLRSGARPCARRALRGPQRGGLRHCGWWGSR